MNGQFVDEIDWTEEGMIRTHGSVWGKSMKLTSDNSTCLEENMESLETNQTINLNEPFELEFYTYLGDSSKEWVADGITIAFHNNPDFKMGSYGGGMGIYHSKLGRAHVLEFDTYYNKDNEVEYEDDKGFYIGDEDLKNPEYIDLQLNGENKKNYVGHVAIRTIDKTRFGRYKLSDHILLAKGTKENPIADGNWKKVVYKWNPHEGDGVIEGSIGDTSFHIEHDIRKDLDDPENVYWGITGSTGIAGTKQAIAFSKVNIPINNVLLNKTELGSRERSIEGAKFNLVKKGNSGSKDPNEWQVIRTDIETDNKGQIHLHLGEVDEYAFIEIMPADGYEIDSQDDQHIYRFKIDEKNIFEKSNGNFEIKSICINNPKKGELEAVKKLTMEIWPKLGKGTRLSIL